MMGLCGNMSHECGLEEFDGRQDCEKCVVEVGSTLGIDSIGGACLTVGIAVIELPSCKSGYLVEKEQCCELRLYNCYISLSGLDDVFLNLCRCSDRDPCE